MDQWADTNDINMYMASLQSSPNCKSIKLDPFPLPLYYLTMNSNSNNNNQIKTNVNSLGTVIALVLVCLFTLAGLVMFALLQRKSMLLRGRSLLLITFSSVGVIANAILVIYMILNGRHTLPCSAWFVFLYVIFGIEATSVTTCLILFVHKLMVMKSSLIHRFKKNKGQAQGKLVAKEETKNAQLSATLEFLHMSPSKRSLGETNSYAETISYKSKNGNNNEGNEVSCYRTITELMRALKHLSKMLFRSRNGRIDVWRSINKGKQDGKRLQKTTSDNVSDIESGVISISKSSEFEAFSWYQEQIIIPLFIFTILMIPFLLAAVIRVTTSPLVRDGCFGCKLYIEDIIAILIATFVVSIFLIVVLYFVRNETDPLGVRREVGLCVIVGVLGCIAWPLEYLAPQSLTASADAAEVFQFSTIWVFGIFSVNFMMTWLQIFLAFCQRGAKQEIEIDLYNLLRDDEGRRALLDFSMNQLSAENILFLESVCEYREEYFTKNEQQNLEDARKIVSSFIDTGSDFQVNLPGYMRDAIITRVKSDKENKHALKSGEIVIKTDLLTLFDPAMAEVEQLVTLDTIPRFVKSELFKLRIQNRPEVMDRIYITQLANADR